MDDGRRQGVKLSQDGAYAPCDSDGFFFGKRMCIDQLRYCFSLDIFLYDDQAVAAFIKDYDRRHMLDRMIDQIIINTSVVGRQQFFDVGQAGLAMPDRDDIISSVYILYVLI